VAARSNVTPEQFAASVNKAKEYIRAGDIIQVVLSQRFEVEHTGDPLDVYRALRCVNPSPYMYCLEFGDRSVVGSSPEIHVRCEEGKVEVRPIAGTRPRAEPIPRPTSGWPTNCWPIRRSGRSTSCWWTWAATIWAGCAATVRCGCPS
jgi:anthranilate/para-aminobenzoate synthase component I